MKFTLIEMMAVITITSFLLVMVISVRFGGAGVNSKRAQVGELIEAAKMANILTAEDSTVTNNGMDVTATYYEHTGNGTTVQITRIIQLNGVLLQMFRGPDPVSSFTFRQFEVFPSGAEVRLEMSTPKDKGGVIRVNSFTGKLSYYEAAQ